MTGIAREMHWRDGIYFRPHDDGSVEVFRRTKHAAYWTADKGFHDPEEALFTVDAESWASIIAFTRPPEPIASQPSVEREKVLREALERIKSAGYSVLSAMDDHNAEHGTYLGGGAFFEMGRAIAVADTALATPVVGVGDED